MSRSLRERDSSAQRTPPRTAITDLIVALREGQAGFVSFWGGHDPWLTAEIITGQAPGVRFTTADDGSSVNFALEEIEAANRRVPQDLGQFAALAARWATRWNRSAKAPEVLQLAMSPV